MLPKSQVYQSHNVPSGSYEVPPPPGSFHGDYAYGPYGSDFHGAPGFPEYGYPAEASWPSVEQGVCRKALGAHSAEGAQGLLGPVSAPAARRAGLRPRWELVMVGPGLPWELPACPSHPRQCSAAFRLPAQVSSPRAGTAAPSHHPALQG